MCECVRCADSIHLPVGPGAVTCLLFMLLVAFNWFFARTCQLRCSLTMKTLQSTFRSRGVKYKAQLLSAEVLTRQIVLLIYALENILNLQPLNSICCFEFKLSQIIEKTIFFLTTPVSNFLLNICPRPACIPHLFCEKFNLFFST